MTRIIILPLNSEDQQPGYHMHVDDVDLIDCVEREAVDNRMNAIVVHPANEESAKALHRFARAQARVRP